MRDLTPRGLPNLAVSEGATTPASDDRAWIWSTTLNRPMFWDGSRWRATSAISVGTTAPANPAVGDLWVDTN